MKKIFLLVIAPILIQYTAVAQVNQVWVNEFNGTGNGIDKSYAMTIDGAGNIYITGESYTSGGNNDCIILKLNSDGNTIWERFYDGPDHNRDIGRAILVDAFGNVYITGESYGSGNYDLITIKFDSAGILQWAARYDGPANGADGGNSIAVDTAGNVYVTGYSDGDASIAFRQDDYITIKYSPSGTLVWEVRYDGPGNYHDVAYSLAVDKNNNIYVTGGSSGVGGTTRYDYATIKYSSNGNELWVARYNHNDFDDIAKVIIVDENDNIFVTGSSDGTSLGIPNFATIKYNSSGNELWIARYSGSGGDNANAMVSDGNGNIYVTGDSKNPSPPYSNDYLTIRYNAESGNTIWSARYNGPGNDADISTSIATDLSGNIYVTGFSRGNGGSYEYATLKYDSDGLQKWLMRYNGTGNGNDLANTVAVDTAGNIYVAGSSSGNSTSDDIVTLKYSQLPTGINESNVNLPGKYFLHQNYPNPFNSSTKMKFSVPINVETHGHASLQLVVYDILGKEVVTLVNEKKSPGTYEVEFDGANIPSGVYFYKLQAGEYSETKKMVLLK